MREAIEYSNILYFAIKDVIVILVALSATRNQKCEQGKLSAESLMKLEIYIMCLALELVIVKWKRCADVCLENGQRRTS